MIIDRKYKEQQRMAKAINNQKDVVDKLNKATEAYDKGEPIISDKEWDDLYFSLTKMETVDGVMTDNSPTQTILYTVVNELEKIEHDHPMLSLPKTKSIEELDDFIGEYDYIVMPKLDGLTCSLTYENGVLVRAETRGNGHIGENILHNALVIETIPKEIEYKERLVVDGEIICKYDDFEEFSNTYKNPRNFAAGSIRLLDSAECAKRKLTFIVWDVIEGFKEFDYLHNKLEKAYSLGFTCAHYTAGWGTLQKDIDKILEWTKNSQWPIDGIVVKYESKKLRNSLPVTDHHLGGALAYKFYDEEYPTKLLDIEWTIGRSNNLTPVAVFEPVEINGTTVERASLHNLTVMKNILGTLTPRKDDIIYVYKSNEIIPQISRRDEIKTPLTKIITLPEICPVCGERLIRRMSDVSDTENLVCENPNCAGKLINRLDHYCSKKGLDIKGLSKKTLEKLIDWNWITKISDIYTIDSNEWIKKPGFGEVSVKKIQDAILDSRQSVKLEDFIAAIGIPLIGKSVSKELVKHIDTWEDFREKINSKFDFSKYDNIGINKLDYIYNFDYTDADFIVKNYIEFAVPASAEDQTDSPQSLKDKKICITGTLKKYKNRSELVDDIVKHGGTVTSSVSKNTDFLINNNIASTSSKNKKAKELDIPILTEEKFQKNYLT